MTTKTVAGLVAPAWGRLRRPGARHQPQGPTASPMPFSSLSCWCLLLGLIFDKETRVDWSKPRFRYRRVQLEAT